MVDIECIRVDTDLWIAPSQVGCMRPVRCRLLLIEEASRGQSEGTRADRYHPRALVLG